MSVWRRLFTLRPITPASISCTRCLQSIPADKAIWAQRKTTVLPNTTRKRSIQTKGESATDAVIKIMKKNSDAKCETANALPRIAKTKKSSQAKGETRTSFMFPSLHQDVVSALSGQIATPTFHKRDSNSGSNKQYKTHVMGKFKCSNHGGSTSVWTSKKVALLIRAYSGTEYNAVVFNQRCKSCEQLGSLQLNEASYVDRVSYRLKKWAGIPMKKTPFALKKGPQHEESLCEGCKQGYCEKKSSDIA